MSNNPPRFAPHITSRNLTGIFELDAEGTVLNSRFAKTSEPARVESNLVGRNFFDDVAEFGNLVGFRRNFREFVKSRLLADNFSFDFRCGEEVVPVRVMMLKASEREYNRTTEIVILDIRKNDVC